MAAYAALVSLMNTVEQIQNHPHLSISLDDCQIEFLRKKAVFFLDFIESYNCHGGSREAAEDLENQIATAAYAAEDAIESHVVDQIHAHHYTEENCDFLLHLQKIIVDMDSIKEKVAKVKEERGLKDQQPAYSMPTANSSRSTTIGETVMVGFDDYLDQLMDLLTGDQCSRKIISIVGMGGIGKTTLARNIYEHSIVMRHFDVRAWVSVSQDYNVRQIFLGALSHLKELTSKIDEGIADERYSEARLGELLYKSLSGRRYLIILDDMWSVEVWDKIKFFFPDNGTRSRLILTTRLSDVAIHCGSSCVIRMNLLDEYECWDLFCRRVFGDEDCPLRLEQIGKEIVELCKGLPLSITVVGGLLQKSDKTLEYWQNVLGNLKSILSSGEGDDQCMNVLYSSYIHLPAHLKPCFLYMGTFEEDSDILVSRIIKLWVAEGFLKPNGTRILEEIAEDYLKDLIDRNLILIGKYRQNGKIRSCHIHDLLRDLCIRIAEKEKFGACGRVGYTSENSSAEAILQNCNNLRFIAYTPSIFSMFKLPSSVTSIWNLQTLIFRGMCYRINAPTEIWKMPQLRHVECNRLCLPDPTLEEDDFCVLRNLQTLVEVVNFRWSKEACKRIPNVRKLRVIYDDSLIDYDDDSCLFYLLNLGGLHKLESLNIMFPFCISRYPVDLLNKKLAFPSSLNKLSLRNCSLTREDMAMIGSLPHLQVLKLEHNSVLGGEWSSVNGEFPRLKLLRIESCDLMHWTADGSAFRVLEKLIVRDLWQLKEIPSDIGEINTLHLIYLHHCSESAAISVLQIMKEQESFGNGDLQIQVNVSSSSSKSFWERLKAESLPIHFIRARPFGDSSFWVNTSHTSSGDSV